MEKVLVYGAMTVSNKIDSRASDYARRNRQSKHEIYRTTARRTTSSFPLSSMFSKCKALAAVALAVGLILWLQGTQIEQAHHTSRAVYWDNRREEVKEAFISSWDAYSKYAWGSLTGSYS